jgi:predicted PurR-regulated permease PerM
MGSYLRAHFYISPYLLKYTIYFFLENINNIKSSFDEWPYTVRLCVRLLLVVLIGFIIIQCQAIFVPLYFSVLISILLLPIANFLERLKLPRALAALLAVLLAFIVFATIVYLLSAQIITFLNDIPSIKKNLADHYGTLQQWLQQKFNISLSQQKSLFNSASQDVQSSGMVYVKETFYTLTQSVAFSLFVLIYSFLILFYRHTIKRFLLTLFINQNKKSIDDVIVGTKLVMKNYMSGLLIEMTIISTSNSIVLMIIGIKYAIFLGVFTGVLNIMPFIGIYSGIIFTALVSLTTSASMSQIIWIAGGLLIVHFIDSNFLMPRIVGSKVKINALITMLGAIGGGMLLGIPGVFLALPTIAILKILFDRIEGMEAWAILLGDETPFPAKQIVQKINNKLTIKKLTLKKKS